jgi:RNA polymerase sigma-70 factor (ECF subfamily)
LEGRTQTVSDDATLHDEIVAWSPNLRAFALSLTQSAQHSDDLVQDTLVKALSNLDKFEMGTNLRAWLFTILRNSFYNEIRHRKHYQTVTLDEIDPRALDLRATQEKYIEFQDVLKSLGRLAPEQREAVILVAAEGLSYEEAAAICNCPVGTVKSRLSRARQRLEVYANGKNLSPVPDSTLQCPSIRSRLQPGLDVIAGKARDETPGGGQGLLDAPSRRLRVLVVEDEALVARDIANMLQDAGFEIVGPAAGPARALELVSGVGCDAAVLDIRLGRRTSEPVALALRERGTPFIAVSAYSRKEMPEGFGDSPLLDKPLKAELLLAHLRRRIEGQEFTRS